MNTMKNKLFKSSKIKLKSSPRRHLSMKNVFHRINDEMSTTNKSKLPARLSGRKNNIINKKQTSEFYFCERMKS